jgi:hypothetical protein
MMVEFFRVGDSISQVRELTQYLAKIKNIIIIYSQLVIVKKLMTNQMPREDLFNPIHKGIRSMIYEGEQSYKGQTLQMYLLPKQSLVS